MTDDRRTASGIPVKGHYGPDDVPPSAREALAAGPGRAPFLRGAYEGMYRTKPWRIFQLSGFGNPADERERLLFLLRQGEGGIIMEHDRNTADHLYNVDHPEVAARREDVGLTGAVIIGVRDYETILEGIPIQDIYTHPGGAVVQHAPFALACFWTVAERRGIDLRRLAGTGQSDFFLT
ncbi:MAG: methylmalonyl-CoA mutase family protein, partial [bacterium]|nr:methylmalonyl-CoA mutase family protein [bacterium]